MIAFSECEQNLEAVEKFKVTAEWRQADCR